MEKLGKKSHHFKPWFFLKSKLFCAICSLLIFVNRLKLTWNSYIWSVNICYNYDIRILIAKQTEKYESIGVRVYEIKSTGLCLFWHFMISFLTYIEKKTKFTKDGRDYMERWSVYFLNVLSDILRLRINWIYEHPRIDNALLSIIFYVFFLKLRCVLQSISFHCLT